MAMAHPTDLDSKRCAALAQTQALDAIVEQTSITQIEVKLPQADHRKVRNQSSDVSMLLFSEELRLAIQLWRWELVDVFDEMRE